MMQGIILSKGRHWSNQIETTCHDVLIACLGTYHEIGNNVLLDIYENKKIIPHLISRRVEILIV